MRIVVSYTKDHSYLHHCLDILERVGFDRKDIWIDGFCTTCNDANAGKSTTHTQPHGERCFDILTQCLDDYVVIMDSDFFCCDPLFWSTVKSQVKKKTIVSIASPWCLAMNMLTTPFVAYNRKEALALVPVKNAWNHFNLVIPGLTDAVFDSLAFVFFTAMKSDKVFILDYWDMSKRIYNFSHFWDSRHSPAENFKHFEELIPDPVYAHLYLGIGVAKHIFHYVSGVIDSIDDRVDGYVDILKSYDRLPWDSSKLVDTMRSLEYQIAFKPEWAKRFRVIFFNYM